MQFAIFYSIITCYYRKHLKPLTATFLTKEKLILAGALISCLIISLFIEWWTRDCGFIMSPDSYNYVSASKSFRKDRTFLSPDGSNYTNWPPLFPVIVSFFQDVPQAVAWIYLICKISISLVVFYLAEQFLNHTFFKIIYFIAVLLSVHILLISVFIWSEALFLALLLVHLYLSLNLKKTSLYFYLLLLTGFLLCLQRNAGAFWVCATALWFMLDKDVSFYAKVRKSILYIMVSCSGLVLWHVHTIFYLNDRTAFSGQNVLAAVVINCQMILINLTKFFIPLDGFLSIILGLIIILSLSFFSYRYFRNDNALRLIMMCVLIYTIGFLPVSKLDIHDMERYFAVILPVFMLLPLKIAERLSEKSMSAVVIVRLIIIVWMIYPAVRLYKNARQWHEVSCENLTYLRK